MRFLVSNDDGVLAPGLAALADALSALGEVTVVAPESERSGFSNAHLSRIDLFDYGGCGHASEERQRQDAHSHDQTPSHFTSSDSRSLR